MSTIYLAPQKWQAEMLANPTDYILSAMDYEDYYQMVMFELFEPNDRKNFFCVFGDETYKQLMLEKYGVENPMQLQEFRDKVSRTMNEPSFKEWHRKRTLEGERNSEAYQNRGEKISKTKQSKEWKETVFSKALKKKMETQNQPERLAARRERNRHVCPDCGKEIQGLGNLKQHRKKHS